MIRGHDSGYDSRKCNMHVVIHFVYAISGNTHITTPPIKHYHTLTPSSVGGENKRRKHAVFFRCFFGGKSGCLNPTKTFYLQFAPFDASVFLWRRNRRSKHFLWVSLAVNLVVRHFFGPKITHFFFSLNYRYPVSHFADPIKPNQQTK